MRNRPSQLSKYHTGREVVLAERLRQGDCTYCPANHGENSHGEKSRWGRKVAAKRRYRTGKGRKEINWHKYGPRDLQDKHYESDNSEKKVKKKMWMSISKGQLKNALEDIGRQMHNRSGHFTSVAWNSLKDEEIPSTQLGWSDDTAYYTLYISKKRNTKR